jgi:hypothetical protein
VLRPLLERLPPATETGERGGRIYRVRQVGDRWILTRAYRRLAAGKTVTSLAEILKRAGAVRAMELDINTYWPSLITYRRPGAIGAANLLPTMVRSPQRFLTPDDRDFFAVYLR